MGVIFSVVIPNHARETELIRAVRSARPGDADVEVIVVDDASPNQERIGEMLESEFGHSVKYLRLSTKSNAAKARNAGVNAAQGEWICFLDSDDEFLPQKFAVLRGIVGTATADVLVHRSLIVVDGVEGAVVPGRGLRSGEAISEYLFVAGELLPTPAMCIRRSLLSAHGYDESYIRHQDWALLLRLESVGCSIQVLPEVLSAVHWSARSTVASKGESSRYSLQWAARERHLMTPAAYKAFVKRYVFFKALRAGERSIAVSVWRGERIVLTPREWGIAVALGVSPRFVLDAAYRIGKAVQVRLLRWQRTDQGRDA